MGTCMKEFNPFDDIKADGFKIFNLADAFNRLETALKEGQIISEKETGSLFYLACTRKKAALDRMKWGDEHEYGKPSPLYEREDDNLNPYGHKILWLAMLIESETGFSLAKFFILSQGFCDQMLQGLPPHKEGCEEATAKLISRIINQFFDMAPNNEYRDLLVGKFIRSIKPDEFKNRYSTDDEGNFIVI